MATWTFVLCGRRGTDGIQLGLVTRLVGAAAASFCVAGVALGDTELRFVWQAWQNRCVALGDTELRFVWQAWHMATWTFVLCGRRGTDGTQLDGTQLGLVTRLVGAAAASFCVAGVARGDTELRFVWQAWHTATWTFVLCGRRGTDGTQLGLVTRLVGAAAASCCVAGVALGDTELRFVWQAWRLATWTFTLCGRRGTYGTQLSLVGASFCVAGVALGDMDLHFVWQAWHLRHSAESGPFNRINRQESAVLADWRAGLVSHPRLILIHLFLWAIPAIQDGDLIAEECLLLHRVCHVVLTILGVSGALSTVLELYRASFGAHQIARR
eukprot:s303_g27.t1